MINLARIRNNVWSVFITLFLVACVKQVEPTKKTRSFQATLEKHLDAIKNSRLDELGPTVSDHVNMISPDGSKIDSKGAFMEFHRNWFNLHNWKWEGKILTTDSTDSMGYGLIQYRFTQRDSVGNIRFQDNEYLVLIFKKNADGWQLVLDQNTRIQNSKDKSTKQ